MTITLAQYITDEITGKNSTIKATINGTVCYVSINATGNRHYEEIMRQVEAGTLTIQDAD